MKLGIQGKIDPIPFNITMFNMLKGYIIKLSLLLILVWIGGIKKQSYYQGHPTISSTYP